MTLNKKNIKKHRKPTHRKHSPFHDYRSRCIYHVTLLCSDRQQVLGVIVGNTQGEARCEHTPLGVTVSQCIEAIPKYAAEHGRKVRIMAKTVMPDHVHFILFVEEPMDCTLGDIIHGLKVACNQALRRLIRKQEKEALAASMTGAEKAALAASMTAALDATALTTGQDALTAAEPLPLSPEERVRLGLGYRLPDRRITSPRMLEEHALFEPDYDETILRRKNQLQAMFDYVHNNPLHRWFRQRYPGWLLPQRGILIDGTLYDALSNVNLLCLTRHQVLVHSYWDDQARRRYMNDCIRRARRGAALVSPFISPKEQQVRDVALEEGHSIIQIADNGFSDLQQCPGSIYDYCRQGQVLILVPSAWPHVEKKGRVSREECIRLNELAARLVAEAGGEPQR